MTDKTHFIIVTTLVKFKDKILIVKRNKHEMNEPGKWAFPGGKVERGETLMEAIRREVKEEVGLDIGDNRKFLGDYCFIRPDGHSTIGLAFLVNALDDKVKLSKDFDDFRWIFPEELKKFDHVKGIELGLKKAFPNKL